MTTFELRSRRRAESHLGMFREGWSRNVRLLAAMRSDLYRVRIEWTLLNEDRDEWPNSESGPAKTMRFQEQALLSYL